MHTTTPSDTHTRTDRPTTVPAEMVCCGTRGQVIELRGGSEPLRMVRCGTCARREWHLGTEQVQVDAAFEVLATTYRSAPRRARAARDRAAAQTSARAAARAQQARGLQQAGPASDGSRTVDRAGLADLLSGWAVLGATG